MMLLMYKDILVLNIDSLEILNNQFLPYALYSKSKKVQKDDIFRWLNKRAIPINRANAHKLYEIMKVDNEIDLMIKTNALSINDNYWIAIESDLEGKQLKWKNINLFDNNISEDISRLAFTGDVQEVGLDCTKLSPEYTGQGTYAKCFRRTDNGLGICKQGTKKEIIAEIYASIASRLIGIPAIEYWTEKVYGIDASVSKIYTNEDISWTSAFDFAHFIEEAYEINIYDYALKMYPLSFYSIVLVDGVVLNSDRHLQNWSIQLSGKDNTIQGIAPLYDFNKSFTGDIKTISPFIEYKNLLTAAREAEDVLQLDLITLLFPLLNKLPKDWQDPFYNRLMYIMRKKQNQDNCY